MKTTYIKITFATAILLGIYSCSKKEKSANEASESYSESKVMVSDSVSSAATTQVKDKKFIKTANVDMEVKDVYDATIAIEKNTQDLGGFVTKSNLESHTISQETYNTSDENAVLVKKYQAENNIQVRIPTENLGQFLTLINDKKVFLNSRIINAEDITSTIKYAELENQRVKKTSENITQLKNSKDKVTMADDKMAEDNQQQLSQLNIADNLKYSTVDIFIKEPKLRTAEIAVTNTKNIDNKYKFNFLYDAKNAFVEGFYLIQKIFVGLITIWPILLITGAVLYFVRKRNLVKTKANNS